MTTEWSFQQEYMNVIPEIPHHLLIEAILLYVYRNRTVSALDMRKHFFSPAYKEWRWLRGTYEEVLGRMFRPLRMLDIVDITEQSITGHTIGTVGYKLTTDGWILAENVLAGRRVG